jgi:IclR family acetate operon transcriptional repressor
MVEHTFRILEVLSGSSTEVRLKEIVSQAKVGPTSTFRILRTLAKLGYIDHDAGTGKYRLTSKIRDLARWSQLGPSLHQIARPFLESLRSQFNETVNLAVLEDGAIVYVEILQSSETFRMAAAVGSRAPIHSTALGKAIAAHIPQERLDEILSRCPWTRFTRRTITKPRDFIQVLAEVRRQGYARDDEEDEHGGSCIASPIRNASTGHAVAGISVSGPTHRIRAKRNAIIAELRRASSAIGQSLEQTS